jgi:hypothetical protein
MTEPAPVVTAHAGVFRALFDHRPQVWSFQYFPNGFIGLSHKSMADSVQCTLESPNQTNLSRFLEEALWWADAVNHRRIRFGRQQTEPHRRRRRETLAGWITLCMRVWAAALTTWTAAVTTVMGFISCRIPKLPAWL